LRYCHIIAIIVIIEYSVIIVIIGYIDMLIVDDIVLI